MASSKKGTNKKRQVRQSCFRNNKQNSIRKIQELNLKDSIVEAFSEELKKMWEHVEHCRTSGSRQYRSEIKKLESSLGLGSA